MLIQITENLDNVFVSADHHLGHENIIKFCNRPFESVDEMDQALIDNWNKVVKPDNTVYHLGDFTLGDWKMARDYLNQLNGNINFLCNPWHHDKRWLPKSDRVFVGDKVIRFLPPMVVLEVPELGKDNHPLAITLCHYPLAVWDRKHYSGICFHGHCHSNYQGEGLILDVGVDNIYKLFVEYRPVSLVEVFNYLVNRSMERMVK